MGPWVSHKMFDNMTANVGMLEKQVMVQYKMKVNPLATP